MEKLGYVHMFLSEPLMRIYYTDDYSKLYYKDFKSSEYNDLPGNEFWEKVDKLLENVEFSIEENIETFGVNCNSPWSDDAIYEDVYVDSNNKYNIEKVIIVYDFIEASIIGCGNTEDEARKDLENKEALIQKHFNPNGDSF